MKIPKVHEFSDRSDKDQKYDYDTVYVDLKPSEYVDDLGMFEDEKELHKFVVRTKYYIRKSLEYSSMMAFLKKKHGMNCCGVHQNIKTWDGFQIQIHHTPLVMEDIIYIVINKRMKRNESMKQSAIAKEIMELHYLGLIGLYPLCETCHEYAHSDSNDLFIPLDSIYGNPQAFFDIYDPYISSAMKVKWRNIVELNKGYTFIQQEIPDSLIRRYVLVEQKGKEMISTRKLYDYILELNK